MTVQEIDYSRKWHIMSATAMGTFLATIDSSIVNVALPTLARDLRTDFPTVQWVALAYMLTLCTLLLSVGRLADIRGKKRIYAIGFLVFTLGSALCALAPTIHWLIVTRVLQATGAAMVLAVGMGITTEAFPPSERGMALGVHGSIVSIGIIAGPTLGGLLLDAFSWHAVFLVNLPIGIVGTWMVLRFVPDIAPVGRQRFDLAGAAALFIGLSALLLAMTTGQSAGFGDPRTLGMLAISLLGLTGFIVIERRVPQPMVDLTVFRNPLFSVNLFTGFLAFVAVASTSMLMPFYLQNVLGYSPSRIGLLLASVPVMLGVAAPVAGILSDRFGTRPITVIGLALLAAGYMAVRTLTTQTTALGYMARFVPVGLGMGIFVSPNNSAVMGTAQRDRLGIVSGMLSLTRTMGNTVGIAVLGAFWSGRVFLHAGGAIAAGATAAPALDQVAGLQDTVGALAALMAIGMLLAVWAVRHERRTIASIPMPARPSGRL